MAPGFYLQRRSDRALFELGSRGAPDTLLIFAEIAARAHRAGKPRPATGDWAERYDAYYRDWFRLREVGGRLVACLLLADYLSMGYSRAGVAVVAARIVEFAGDDEVSVLNDCSSDEQLAAADAPGAPGIVGSRYLDDDRLCVRPLSDATDDADCPVAVEDVE